MKIIVAGGAGFMGSHMVDYLLAHYSDCTVVCVDKLSYACHFLIENLFQAKSYPNFRFFQLDLAESFEELKEVVSGSSAVINFAAETCVDLSFQDPRFYVTNNVLATLNLLECCRENLKSHPELAGNFHYIHISTDEVYGEQNDHTSVGETSILNPSNPYSATKAACDLIINSYVHSYKLPVTIVRPNNVYGLRQFPEKLAAVTLEALKNADQESGLAEAEKIPIHGDGRNLRRYLHVSDFVNSVDTVWTYARRMSQTGAFVSGEIYNVGTEDEISNLELVGKLVAVYWEQKFGGAVEVHRLVKFVEDRDYNDARYATDLGKIRGIGWEQKCTLDDGIRELVKLTISNE